MSDAYTIMPSLADFFSLSESYNDNNKSKQRNRSNFSNKKKRFNKFSNTIVFSKPKLYGRRHGVRNKRKNKYKPPVDQVFIKTVNLFPFTRNEDIKITNKMDLIVSPTKEMIEELKNIQFFNL